MREEVRQGIEWLESGQRTALAMVSQTWGSAPRPPGSLLFVTDSGDMAGSVSGGCVEGDVLATALDLDPNSKPRELAFGVTNEDAWAAGLACGGEIRVVLLPLRRQDLALLHDMETGLKSRRSFALTIAMENGALALSSSTVGKTSVLRLDDNGETLDAASKDVPRTIELNLAPLPHLIISGVVHLSDILSRMALLADYDVTLVDPRPAFTDGRRLAAAKLVADWPDAISSGFDLLTAAIALTHDPKIDDILLSEALKSECFYIGALGSRKSHAARLERLSAQGFGDHELARIKGPIGYAIGSKGPGEIASSILSEIIAEYRAAFHGAEVMRRDRTQSL